MDNHHFEYYNIAPKKVLVIWWELGSTKFFLLLLACRYVIITFYLC
jgi:hypothetical protein